MARYTMAIRPGIVEALDTFLADFAELHQIFNKRTLRCNVAGTKTYAAVWISESTIEVLAEIDVFGVAELPSCLSKTSSASIPSSESKSNVAEDSKLRMAWLCLYVFFWPFLPVSSLSDP